MTEKTPEQNMTAIILRHDEEIKDLFETMEKMFWRFENKKKEIVK